MATKKKKGKCYILAGDIGAIHPNDSETVMALKKVKTESSGGKSKVRWVTRAEAKTSSKKRRRRQDKRESLGASVPRGTGKAWGREFHEQFAIEAIASAKRGNSSTYDCDPTSVYAASRMNRDVARARAHLASIGTHEGPRTRRLWGAIAKAEDMSNQANNRIAKCLLR